MCLLFLHYTTRPNHATVRSASFVLLQGVPATIPLDKVRSAILRVPGVQDVHGESFFRPIISFVLLALRVCPFRVACLVSLREQGRWIRPRACQVI